MALDKQKILNELGNVVNQLQSADCGCMGKLFSNSNQPNSNAMPANDGHMQGCCHGCGHGCHGYNAPGAGEPFSGNRNCMGYCNQPKIFADTYNYLNRNMMQPVIKEVYDDLKSISPTNTVMNSPIAAQMGLAPGNNANPAGASPMGAQMGNIAQNQMTGGTMGNPNGTSNVHHGPNVRFGNPNMNNSMQLNNPNGQQQSGQPMAQMGQPTAQMGQPMASMGGMGPNILNMMMGNNNARPTSNPNQVDVTGNAQQSPEVGLASNMRGVVDQGQYNGGMPGQYNTGNMGMNQMGQGTPGAPVQNAQYMSQPNTYTGTNLNMQGNTNSNTTQMNPGAQQMRAMNAVPVQPQMNAPNPYGQHTAGMTKFNEMFPGVLQGGDLGFDPMAIAIQMNPANQQQAAMNTMQKMMMSNGEQLSRANASLLQPVINAANAATANITQNLPSNIQAPSQQNVVPTSMQQIAGGSTATIQNSQVPQQQVYTSLTGAPTMSQQQMPQQQIPTQQQQYQQQYQGHYLQPNQQIIDRAGALPTVYEGSGHPNARQEPSSPTELAPPTSQQMIKEPIFPADTSRNQPPAQMNMKPQRYYQYNTLGQPVELLPASEYRFTEPNLPQTLSPQPATSKVRSDPGRYYSNVKATVSKTSIMGNKPVGRTPSRSQLQQIYNQYKGSQSYTQQNIKPADNGASYSEGHLNVAQGNANRQAPIERVGGDTAANNAMNNSIPYKAEQMLGQVGDVPANNKPLDIPVAEKAPGNHSKVRNGLQDMTYTSYATSAAWSFHGATPAPFSTSYRYRNKA